jgi:hypothetical protein
MPMPGYCLGVRVKVMRQDNPASALAHVMGLLFAGGVRSDTAWYACACPGSGVAPCLSGKRRGALCTEEVRLEAAIEADGDRRDV